MKLESKWIIVGIQWEKVDELECLSLKSSKMVVHDGRSNSLNKKKCLG